MTFSNNERYEGEWSSNKMHGYGVFFENNGSVYYGEFNASKRYGYGILVTADGTVIVKGGK
jgi:hypothetical protein